MEFPQQVITEITVPNNVPFGPGYDVIGIGTNLPPLVIAAGYPAAIMFYSSSYDPNLTVPQIKYQFIADKNGTIYFGYGLVANASVSQTETIVTYEGHGFAGTDAQTQINNLLATAGFIGALTVNSLAANNSILYKGTELQTLLDAISAQATDASRPRGIIAYGTISSGGPFTTSSAVKIGMFYIGANLNPSRTYRLSMNSMILNGSTANCSIGAFINYTTNGTVPATAVGGATSNLITTQKAIPQFYEDLQWNVVFSVPTAAQWNFLFGIDNSITNHPGTATCSYNGSVSVSIEDIGPALSNTAQLAFVAPPVAPTNYSVFQYATTTHAYKENGAVFDTNAEMYTGQSPYAPNGRQTSDAFFAGTGANTLGYLKTTGATAASLKYIRVSVLWRHWYYGAGGTMRFGWTDGTGYHFLGDYAVGPAAQGITINLIGTACATAILNGSFVGFNFGGSVAASNFTPAGDYHYYGYMDGQAQGNPPLFEAGWAI